MLTFAARLECVVPRFLFDCGMWYYDVVSRDGMRSECLRCCVVAMDCNAAIRRVGMQRDVDVRWCAECKESCCLVEVGMGERRRKFLAQAQVLIPHRH